MDISEDGWRLGLGFWLWWLLLLLLLLLLLELLKLLLLLMLHDQLQERLKGGGRGSRELEWREGPQAGQGKG